MRSSLLLIAFAATLVVGRLNGDVIISAPTVATAPGSSGVFDVLLTNNSTSAVVGIGAFSFDISTTNPGVRFTGASTNTTAAPYVYAGDSFAAINGFPLATRTGQELTASDIPNDGVEPFVGSGQTVSLGEISYVISPAAAFTSVPITFSSTGTSLAGYLGSPVAFTTVNGAVSLVPEPAPLSLLGVCILAALASALKGARYVRAAESEPGTK